MKTRGMKSSWGNKLTRALMTILSSQRRKNLNKILSEIEKVCAGRKLKTNIEKSKGMTCNVSEGREFLKG